MSGTIDCAIFDSRVDFPTKVLHSATQVMITKILKNEALFTFEDIPPGTYALVVFHDENMASLTPTGRGSQRKATVFQTM
jgi:uncharacterized protein (DUF2141 family)